jgi:hypothetical protein
MSVNMMWVCVVTQEGKHLHTALGYTAAEAKQKATSWRDKHIESFPAAIAAEDRLRFPKSA